METCFCEGGMETEVKLDGGRNEISGDGVKMCVISVPFTGCQWIVPLMDACITHKGSLFTDTAACNPFTASITCSPAYLNEQSLLLLCAVVFVFISAPAVNHWFGKRLLNVKLRLFRTYWVCLYGTSLWTSYSPGTMLQLEYCYHKCIELFVVTSKLSTTVLLLWFLIWCCQVLPLLCITFAMRLIFIGIYVLIFFSYASHEP